MSAAVVDTNVLVVANGRDTQASVECQRAAVRVVIRVQESNALILDANREILDEYGRNCSHSGQPGVGDEFFRWAFDNQAGLCSVALSKNPERGFDEFPDDPALKGFDRDDRVFVAVSVASSIPSRIVNAVDSDYSHYRDSLRNAGVDVEELCPTELKPPAL